MIFFHRNRCYNGGKLHRFQPRYTQTQPTIAAGNDMSTVWQAMTKMDRGPLRVYVGDVCAWCGATAKPA